MSFEMGGVTFPDLPAAVTAVYPNLLVVSFTTAATAGTAVTFYYALLSKGPFVFVELSNVGDEAISGIFEGVGIEGAFVSMYPSAAYMYSGGSAWTQELNDDGSNPCANDILCPVMRLAPEAELAMSLEGLGANHTVYYGDINGNASSRIYAFGGMTDSTPIPDVPQSILKNYPYVTVLRMTLSAPMNGVLVEIQRAYSMIATEYPLFFADLQMIVGISALISENVGNAANGMYAPGGAFEWQDVVEGTSNVIDLEMIPIGSMAEEGRTVNYDLRWANYTVNSLELSSMENGELIFSDTPYYRGTGVVEPPEEYGVKRKIISQLAHHARRLGAGAVKLETDDIPVVFADLADASAWMGKLCNSWGKPDIVSDASSIDPRPFRFGNDVQTATFPNATHLQAGAFQDCKKLTKVTAPKLAYIYSDVFKGCSSLKTVVLRNSRMCSLIGLTAFEGTPIADGTGYIYVPASLVETYKANPNWSTFAAQIVAEEEMPDEA